EILGRAGQQRNQGFRRTGGREEMDCESFARRVGWAVQVSRKSCVREAGQILLGTFNSHNHLGSRSSAVEQSAEIIDGIGFGSTPQQIVERFDDERRAGGIHEVARFEPFQLQIGPQWRFLLAAFVGSWCTHCASSNGAIPSIDTIGKSGGSSKTKSLVFF